MTSSSSIKKVILKSSDGVEFEVYENVAIVCETLKNMLIVVGESKEVEIPLVTGKTLKRVIEYCEKHSDESIKNMEVEDLKEWDSKFIVGFSTNMLYDLIVAAHYLEVRGLMYLTASRIAGLIRSNSKEGQTILKELNSSLEQEKEQLLKENPLAFWTAKTNKKKKHGVVEPEEKRKGKEASTNPVEEGKEDFHETEKLWREVRETKREKLTLGHTLPEKEEVYGKAHIFFSPKDTFIHVTNLSGREILVRISGGMKVKLERDIYSPYPVSPAYSASSCYAAGLAAEHASRRIKELGVTALHIRYRYLSGDVINYSQVRFAIIQVFEGAELDIESVVLGDLNTTDAMLSLSFIMTSRWIRIRLYSLNTSVVSALLSPQCYGFERWDAQLAYSEISF